MGLVRVIETFNQAGKQGTLYEVLLPEQQTSRAERPRGMTDAPASHATNKDHDHEDLKKTDHHQSETMMIYQSITGNQWSKADEAAYEKIRSVEIETIAEGIKITNARAATHPGSLAYFIKEIL